MTQSNAMSKFLVAFNGSRDGYHAAAALADVGQLDLLVTDFYLPDFLSNSIAKSRSLRRRRNPMLPSKNVSLSYKGLACRFTRRFEPKNDPWFKVDKAIGEKARKLLLERDSIPFIYSNYAYWALQGITDRPRLIFQYHPHTSFCFNLLRDDFERYPTVVEWSFYNEVDTTPPDAQHRERLEEWKLATDFICASGFTKRSLIAQGANDDRIHVVPYGAERLDFFQNREHNGRCQFLFVGQGVQRKGLHHLLVAWKRAKMMDADLHLVCSRIDPGIASLTHHPNVHFHSWLDRAELQQKFTQADVFVLPSLVEGFGLVYLEALAAGNYVIGTHNTGLPDLRPAPDIAAVLEAGNIDALSECLLDAQKRWRNREIDRVKIANFAGTWSWDAFRSGIVDSLNAIASAKHS